MSMIPKSGHRFSEKIMREQNSMIPKSGHRFSDKIMREQNSMIPKSGHRFSDKIMLQQKLSTSSNAKPGVSRIGRNKCL